MWLDQCGHAYTIVGVYGRTYLVMLAGNLGLRDRGRTDQCGHDCVAVPVCVTVGLCGHACVALFGLCGRACVEVSVYVTVGLRGRTWVVWTVCSCRLCGLERINACHSCGQDFGQIFAAAPAFGYSTAVIVLLRLNSVVCTCE